MAELKFRVEDELLDAIKLAATQKGVSEAELCRRLIRRQLGLDAGMDQIVVIQEALRGILQQELSPIRRLSFVAAFEAAATHNWSHMLAGYSLSGQRIAEASKIFAEIHEGTEPLVRKLAAKRVREPHPEPPEPLPGADEEFVLDPVDAQLFQQQEQEGE